MSQSSGAIRWTCLALVSVLVLCEWNSRSHAAELVGAPVTSEIRQSSDLVPNMQNRQPLSASATGAPPLVAPFTAGPGSILVPALKGSTEGQTSQDQTAAALLSQAAAPTVSRSFVGLLDNNTTIPPDTMGAVGPSHLMETLNSQVAFFNKTTGAMIGAPVSLQTFWNSLGIGATQPANGPFDPKVIWDQYSGRFIVVTCGGSASPNSWLMVGVSATSDPTGQWFLYAFDADKPGATQTDNWFDYPGLGVDQNNVYVTGNMFSAARIYQTTALWAIPKAPLLTGGAASGFVFFGTSFGFTLQPAHTFGASTFEHFVSGGVTDGAGNDYVRLGRIDNTAPRPTYQDLGFIRIANYPNSGNPGVAQQGTTVTIQSNDPRLLNAVFRNNRLWTTHTVPNATGTRTEIAWYELDPATANGTAAGIPVQQGRIASGTSSYTFSSIAVNSANDAMIGFSAFSSTTFAGAAYSSRSAGDAAGTMSAPVSYKAGEGSYHKTFGGGRNRWGDYSATVVDPSDDRSFWTLQEYADIPAGTGDGSGRWATYWATTSAGAPTTFTVMVAKDGTGTGTVTSTPAGINCGGECNEQFPGGTTVTMTATPSAGSVFAGWNGGGCSGSGTCIVSTTATVTATFNLPAPAPFTVTVNKNGTGTGTVISNPVGINCGGDCTETYPGGTTVTLTATADAGSVFTSWNGGGCAGAGTCVVSAAATVTATFTVIPPPITVTVNKNGTGAGTITSNPAGINCGGDCTETYPGGTTVTLTPSPTAGSLFAGWSGGCTGTASCQVASTVTVTATFNLAPSPQTFTVTVLKGGTGTGKVVSAPTAIDCGAICSANFSSTTTVTLTATADGGSTFTGWSGSGCTGTGTCVVNTSATVTASFDVPAAPPGGGGGGCTIAQAGTNDALMPIMLVMAIGALVWRSRRRL